MRFKDSIYELNYFDNNSTTPVCEDVVECLSEWSTQFGNPSSTHQLGRGPKQMLREARAKVAELINANPLEVVFTSSGTEANQLALLGSLNVIKKCSPEKNQVLLSSIEHPAVMATIEDIKTMGFQVELIPVLATGELDLKVYKNLLNDRTALVSVMFVNNETGVIQPLKSMCQMAHESGALFHTDAVQALGKVVIDLQDLNVDYASFSAHKFYSIKGTGALYVKSGAPLEPQTKGGGQERKRRAGTENTLAIASFGKVAQFKDQITEQSARLSALRDRIELGLSKAIGAEFNASNAPRVSNTSSVYLAGVDAQTLLMSLDMQGIFVSQGSACSSGSTEPSPVLLAMGLDKEKAKSCLRVSLGWSTTEQQVDYFIDKTIQAVRHLRGIQ